MGQDVQEEVPLHGAPVQMVEPRAPLWLLLLLTLSSLKTDYSASPSQMWQDLSQERNVGADGAVVDVAAGVVTVVVAVVAGSFHHPHPLGG